MSGEIQEVYRSILLDHSRNPRKFRLNQGANCSAKVLNRLCGDELEIFCDVENNEIQNICFHAKGCAVCIASGSLLCESAERKQLKDIRLLAKNIIEMRCDAFPDPLRALGAFADYPARHRCVSLAWEAFINATETKVASYEGTHS